jgi:hypothetical protein
MLLGLLQACAHPYVVGLIGYSNVGAEAFVVTERCARHVGGACVLLST